MCTTAQPCQIMLCTRLVYSCNVTPRQRGSNAFLSFAPSLSLSCTVTDSPRSRAVAQLLGE